MNENKRSETVRYFTERISHCQTLARELSADDRADEAVFAKVQMNIYDVFNTIFSVALKTAGENDEKAIEFFLTKLQQIPQSWHTALVNAERHGESDKAHIERLKLDTASEIKSNFNAIWEVNQ